MEKHPKEKYPSAFDPKWQKEICENARRNGFIAINHLAFILAVTTDDDIIPFLWGKYQLSIRHEEEPDVTTPQSRAGAWIRLLERFTKAIVAGILGGLNPIRLLPSYSYDERTGALEGTEGSGRDYIKLTDIRDYFVKYLDIPLPAILSPEHDVPEGTLHDKPDLICADTYSFIRCGNFWKISYGDEQATIQNLDGIHYIAILLDQRGTSISCKDLHQVVSKKSPGKTMSSSAAIDEGLNIGGSVQRIGDAKAKKNYQAEYQRLQNELDKAGNEMERREIEEEMETLLRHLKKSHKAFTDMDAKKAQNNVVSRLQGAYKAMRKEEMKKLAKHLALHIVTDKAYGLRYSGTIGWQIVF